MSTPISRYYRNLAAFLVVFLICSCVHIPAASASKIIMLNPYSGVNWAQDELYKANFHAHTSRSIDGTQAPGEVIDGYRSRGYKILALSDHSTFGVTPTWPWQEYGRLPSEMGMIAIQGHELGMTQHHTLSLFNSYCPTLADHGYMSSADFISKIGEHGGLAVYNHPGNYNKTLEYYIEEYTRSPHLIGIEVFNPRYADSEPLWDRLLTHFMPGRPLWGLANDDSHGPEGMGFGWTVFPMSGVDQWENSLQVRSALENGRFYFCKRPDGANGDLPPVIQSIDVSLDRITISASGCSQPIQWITDGGQLVHEGETIDLRNTPQLGSYVRARLVCGNSVTFTNPFGLAEHLPVTGVVLDRNALKLPVGSAAVALNATVSPAGATYPGVRWSSSEPDVASVDQQGLVTPHSAGSTVITVTTEDGGFTDSCLVEVQVPVTGVSLNCAELTLAAGGASQTLAATIAPEDATNQKVAWSSSNEAVAVVENGVVVPLLPGSAVITVTTEDGGFTDSCTVNVVAGELSLAVAPLEVDFGAVRRGSAANQPLSNGGLTLAVSSAAQPYNLTLRLQGAGFSGAAGGGQAISAENLRCCLDQTGAWQRLSGSPVLLAAGEPTGEGGCTYSCAFRLDVPEAAAPGSYSGELIFELIPVTPDCPVNVAASPADGGVVTGGGSFSYGSSVTVTAAPYAGYRFVNWTEQGQVVATTPEYTFFATGPHDLIANFVREFTVNLSAEPSGAGTVSGGGRFDAGAPVTVTAAALHPYTFQAWLEDGAVVSTNPEYSFNATANRNLLAQFRLSTLYDFGNEYLKFVAGRESGGGSQSKQERSLYLYATGEVLGGGRAEKTYVTDLPVNLDGVSAIKVTWENTGSESDNNHSYLVVSGNQMGDRDTYDERVKKQNVFATCTDTLDVSHLQGSYYIRVHARRNVEVGSGTSELRVYKIWFE